MYPIEGSEQLFCLWNSDNVMSQSSPENDCEMQ